MLADRRATQPALRPSRVVPVETKLLPYPWKCKVHLIVTSPDFETKRTTLLRNVHLQTGGTPFLGRPNRIGTRD